MNTHMIRVITVDGELLFEEDDFATDPMWEFFDETVRMGNPGDVVQLIRVADDYVEAETIVW